jgi:hypothetical protein
MKRILEIYKNILKLLGFKKFMWFHATGFLMFALAMNLSALISPTKLDLGEFIGFQGMLLIIYILLRLFQSFFYKRIEEDSYMVFFGKGKFKKKVRKRR